MMEAPPFRLARSLNIGPADSRISRDACCQPAPTPARALHRRVRLSELDSHLHCSIIGTCLSTSELRKLVPKYADIDRRQACDLEIHHTAVELAMADGPASKALHKALDERYAGAIRQFEQARDPEAVLALWNEARASGDISPAYWALMTHPQSTIEVRQVAFGELHMLSHLVGAANRADIRRLVALEKDNAALKDKVERQQNRLQEMAAERDNAMRDLAAQATQSAPREPQSELEAQVLGLREKLEDCERRLALHTSRREVAEQRTIQEQEAARVLRERLDEAHALHRIMQAESQALEGAMSMQPDEADTRRGAYAWIADRRIVYVGGRPGSNAALKRLVASVGGELIVHDGGVEDRKGLLAATLPGADLVVFPVDCIDHDSMSMLKRVCERHQVRYYPLRTASVASFVELMTRLAPDREARASTPPASAFCLRHG
ncbi:peptidase [Caballeronia terrestris]|uniref:Peptidase n=2 Tax=Caballeronia terrestris TaxID=1226301 RepID=A0A158F207_9BURK|nr:peptidase [Caballeronia terrestris]